VGRARQIAKRRIAHVHGRFSGATSEVAEVAQVLLGRRTFLEGQFLLQLASFLVRRDHALAVGLDTTPARAHVERPGRVQKLVPQRLAVAGGQALPQGAQSGREDLRLAVRLAAEQLPLEVAGDAPIDRGLTEGTGLEAEPLNDLLARQEGVLILVVGALRLPPADAFELAGGQPHPLP